MKYLLFGFLLLSNYLIIRDIVIKLEFINFIVVIIKVGIFIIKLDFKFSFFIKVVVINLGYYCVSRINCFYTFENNLVVSFRAL